MLLFYLDEYGDNGLSTRAIEESPFFVLGAMCIRDTQRLSLYEQIRRLKSAFFPGWTSEAWAESEIKGSYLSQSLRRLDRGLNPRRPSFYQSLTSERLSALVKELFNIIHRFSPLFYLVAVDKIEQVARYTQPLSPVGIAYAHLQTRAALLVAEVYGRQEGAIFLADEENQHERLFRRGEMRRTRETIMQNMERPVGIELVLDKPLWINQGELIVEREIAQLVDFGLYIVASSIVQDNWNENSEWLRNLSPYLARHWGTGDVWNAGITITPRPERYPVFPFQ